jgi:hypothetical protein
MWEMNAAKQLCSFKMLQQQKHAAWSKKPKYGYHLNSHRENLEISPVTL